MAEAAIRAELGEQSVLLTPQSLGGEDFAWILEKVPGAMVRLGTRTPGGETFDLHRPDFDVDERSGDRALQHAHVAHSLSPTSAT